MAIAADDDLDAILSGKEQMPWVEIRLGVGQTAIPDSYPTKVVFYPGEPVGAPGIDEWQLDRTMDSDRGLAFSYGIVAANLRPFGLVGGVEMVYVEQSLDLASSVSNGDVQDVPDDAAGIRYQTFGGNALLGVGYALGTNAHVELLGVLGAGAADIGIHSGDMHHQVSSSGWYWNYGLRGGLYYRFGKFVLGGFVEYMHVDVDVSQGWADAYTYTDTDASGVGYRIELGYHIQ
ncbi:MAG: hypothetical protein J0M02_15920 [Planctomycetes bacterium]|nr:hypothetical protein [Planctomycetota bacterium]